MGKYHVYITQQSTTTFSVEADSVGEAAVKYAFGKDTTEIGSEVVLDEITDIIGQDD